MEEPSSSSSPSSLPPLLTLILLLLSSFPLPATAQFLTDDSTALFTFKSALATRTHSLDNWTSTSYPCTAWNGVYCNSTFTGPRVFQLRLPGSGLSGAIPSSSLSMLSSLRILSLRHNSITSPLPDDLSAQKNLTQLILNNNKFTGLVPAVISALTSLQRLDLSFNNFSGAVPSSLTNLTQLDMLFLHNNSFSGTLPQDLNFNNLVQFNISFNSELSGPIPESLRRFPASAFIGTKLCGGPLGPCSGSSPSPPAAVSPSGPTSSPSGSKKKLSTGAIIGIGFGSVFAVLALMFLLAILFKKGQNDNQRARKDPPLMNNQTGGPMVMNGSQAGMPQAGMSLQAEPYGSSGTTRADQRHNAATAPQPEPYSTATAFPDAVPAVAPVPEAAAAGQDRARRLVFFRKGQVPRFDLEQLLRASAEVLGRGTFGTAYKAVLETGEIVAVKRMQKVYLPEKEFRARIARVGELEHANIVPLIAYYHSKDETLLTYDYMPMGSLSAVLHGNRGSGIPPLNWETRANIALAISRGLQYIHSAGPTFSHGNIKSSNVLLTTSYEARLSDHGLFSFALTDSSSTSRIMAYRAPEITDPKKISQKADIYSFGVLLLELLTGKAPGRAIMGDEIGVDLPRWVRSVLDEDFSGDVFDMDLVRVQPAGEDMMQLLKLGIDCTKLPDQRPNGADVAARIEEIVKNRDVSASGESGAE